MPARYTNRLAHWQGKTVPMTVRVIQPIADVIDKVVADETEPAICNRSEAIQDALARWAMEEE